MTEALDSPHDGWSDTFRQSGFAIFTEVLPDSLVDELISKANALSHNFADRRRGGIRNLFEAIPESRDLADSPAIKALVTTVLGYDAIPVRCILFDKVPGTNWKVPWHQDLAIAVQAKVEIDGYHPWSVKDGVLHVQPPAEILEKMLAIRIHLDDCGELNGPLRVLPGTHLLGKIPEQQIERLALDIPAVTCVIPAGGAMLMSPLLLHASSPAAHPAHRRVIHIEYASATLPAGLNWYCSQGSLSC